MAASPLHGKSVSLEETKGVEAKKAWGGNRNILNVKKTTPGKKGVDETELAITELTDHVKSIGGDIARLGEERIVITPPGVKIWRRETAAAEASIPAASFREETLPGTG